MAGSPKKRARREAAAAARAALPEFPERTKPLEEMTPAEQQEHVEQLRQRVRAELKVFKQGRRETDLRAGKARPRNFAEIEIFAADLLNRRVDDDKNPDA